MKAVILCGGTGSRLRPLTEARPKPLIKLLNVPVLVSIIKKLESAGIRDIYLSLGYMAQDIINKCENIKTEAKLTYREEAKPLGTAGGVKNCIGSTDDNILVVSGDNVFDIDINAAAHFHERHCADFTVIGKKVADPREYGCIVKDENNTILSFIEKPSWENADSFLINTGMYIMSGKILSLIPQNTFFDFAEDLFPKLFTNGSNFLCCETEGFWGDIGEFEAYLSLTEEILSERTADFPLNGSLILHDETDSRGNTFTAPCLIGNGCEFGEKNSIGPFAVFGSGVKTGSHCTVERAVIGENCLIGDRSDIIGAVLDDNVNVGASCVIEKNAVVGYGADIGKFTRLLSGVKIWPGKTILSESVINKDMFYETPASLEFDIFGISGKAFSQFTLPDAVKIGQALASLKGVGRVGVSSDGKSASGVYRELLGAGILSCGAACYDFEESFMSQSYFYSAYCELDAFIYVSAEDDIINLCFFGKNGMPVSARAARMINNNYRFSAFSFARPDKTGVLYRMSLLSTAYSCAMRKLIRSQNTSLKITAECENPYIKSLLDDFLKEIQPENAVSSLQFLFNPLGTDMYCLENDRFFSSDRIRSVLCELEFAAGNDVVIPENAFSRTESIAEKYGRTAKRVYEGSFTEFETDKKTVTDNLWNFDALFLCVKLLDVIFQTGVSVAELCEMQNDFSVRSRIIELACAPSGIRNKITASLNAEKVPGEVYYNVISQKGDVKVRQLGNTSRIRMLVEAADMETAKEIMVDMSGKFAAADIDNISF